MNSAELTPEDAEIIYGRCGVATADLLTAVKMIRSERREKSVAHFAADFGVSVVDHIICEAAKEELEAGRGSAPSVSA